jgi:ABC-type uncharacterized transport system permease subunit
MLTKGFNYKGIGSLAAGCIALVIVFLKTGAMLSFWQIVCFAFFIIIGTVLYLAFIIFYFTIVFVIIHPVRIKEIFDRVIMFAQYPAEVFSGIGKMVYLTVLPIAVWVYFPTRVLLGHYDSIAFLSAFVAVLLFFISIILWNHEVKKYTSAGG